MAHGTGYDGGATGMMLGVTIPKWYLWWTRIISHLSRWMMFGKGNDPYIKHISFPRSYLNLLINVRCVKVEPNTIICSAAINACAKAGQWRRRWFLGWHGMTWDDIGLLSLEKTWKILEDDICPWWMSTLEWWHSHLFPSFLMNPWVGIIMTIVAMDHWHPAKLGEHGDVMTLPATPSCGD